jgi:CMP-2-keto-3-deoxyoctulosonic acid synthetase
MKNKLKQIFQDLANGKLTQKEALENIRVLKLQTQYLVCYPRVGIRTAASIE